MFASSPLVLAVRAHDEKSDSNSNRSVFVGGECGLASGFQVAVSSRQEKVAYKL